MAAPFHIAFEVQDEDAGLVPAPVAAGTKEYHDRFSLWQRRNDLGEFLVIE
jgi:hypothetical protein